MLISIIIVSAIVVFLIGYSGKFSRENYIYESIEKK